VRDAAGRSGRGGQGVRCLGRGDQQRQAGSCARERRAPGGERRGVAARRDDGRHQSLPVPERASAPRGVGVGQARRDRTAASEGGAAGGGEAGGLTISRNTTTYLRVTLR